MKFGRLAAALLAVLILAALAGCTTTTAGGAVGAERSQLLLVSSAQLEQMAAESYNEFRTEAASKGTLNKDPALLQRVRGIAARLQPQTAVFRPEAPNWKWEVNVVADDQLNAFCMPGGKIVVYSGIVEQLALSDAEIAVVMGHEIAHALREHSREQVSQALAARAAIDVGAAVFGWGGGASGLAGLGYDALIATRFSRTDEKEADRIGLELAARAGYDPAAGVSLWQKMTAKSGGARPPEFLSSHPAGEKRVAEVQSVLPVVQPLYEAAKRK